MSNGAVAKTTWTEADFSAMGWHDNAIHAVAVEQLPDNPGRLLLDLDYIVEWVAPEPPAKTLSFWICRPPWSSTRPGPEVPVMAARATRPGRDYSSACFSAFRVRAAALGVAHRDSDI